MRIVVISIAALLLTANVFAQTAVVREIEGEITWLGKDRIAIVYSSDPARSGEEEIMLPFDKTSLKLKYVRSLAELSQGDRVHLEYEEVPVKNPDGKDVLGRKIRSIAFVRKAVRKQMESPKAASSEKVIDSANETSGTEVLSAE